MIVRTDKHGTPFQIDDEDYEAVRRYCWAINRKGYVTTNTGSVLGQHSTLPLHLFLLGPAPAGLVWDHRNRDKRDNRRANLRAVTLSESNLNRGHFGTGERWLAGKRVPPSTRAT